MKCGKSISLFWAYGGLGDSSSMRHVCRYLFHSGDSGTSRITADQVRPATTANHSLLSNNPTDVLLTPELRNEQRCTSF